MGKVVIDMNGFYSHFPHIGPVWKLTEETLLTELQQFTQKFYRAKWDPAKTIFGWYLRCTSCSVGWCDFLHPFYILVWRGRKSLHNYSHSSGRTKIYCGKFRPLLGLLGTANWNSLPPVGARTRQLSKKVEVWSPLGRSPLPSYILPLFSIQIWPPAPLLNSLSSHCLTNQC